MYCVTNYATENKSLWITKDCSKCELRDGFGDLTEHTTYVTKLRVFRRVYLEYYNLSWQFSFHINNRRAVYTAYFEDIGDYLYLIFKTIGTVGYFYQVPYELLTCDLHDITKFMDNPVIYYYIQDMFFNRIGVNLNGDNLKNYLIGGII